MSRVDVSMIVVTFNSASVIEGCVRSLPQGERYELIVVDNQSEDDSASIVQRARPDAKVIVNGTNAGFAAAVNKAAAWAVGDYILLVNPDARIVEATLNALVTRARSISGCAVIAPLVTDSEDSFSTIAAGHFPTLWRMFTHATGLSRLGGRVALLEGHYLLRSQVVKPECRDVDWVSGGCMLIDAETWRREGGLTERWFMYAEDIEFCLRVRRAGERVVLDTHLRATHEIGGSSSGVDGRVGTRWLTNLYDLYNWKLSPNRLASWLWRQIVTAGFRARALLARVRRSRADYPDRDYVRFRAYSEALGKGR